MTTQIVTPRSPRPHLTAVQVPPGARIVLRRARRTSDHATARMIECLAARLSDIHARRQARD